MGVADRKSGGCVREIKWRDRVEKFQHSDVCDVQFPGTDLILLIDQLPFATACTIAAARIKAEAEAGGPAGESFLLFSVHRQLRLERSVFQWVVCLVVVLCIQVEIGDCMVLITQLFFAVKHCNLTQTLHITDSLWGNTALHILICHAWKVRLMNPAMAYKIHANH